MKRIVTLLIVSVLASVMLSCSDNSGKRKIKKSEDNVVTDVSNVVYTKYEIPLPVDLLTYLVSEEIPYNVDLLAPLEYREKYSKETKQAMVLGLYSADIAYCSMYKRQQELLDYFNCAMKLADRLDISEGFNYKYVERMESNISCVDSLSNIADNAYWRACNFLSENEKNNILPFVIYGGWVESQYLTIVSNDQKSTRMQILNQHDGLLKLISYFYDVMIESSAFYYNYDIKTIILQLNNIKKVYEKVPGKEIDAQLYNDICMKIKTMRSEIVDPEKN